jgi:hypothetical protein
MRVSVVLVVLLLMVVGTDHAVAAQTCVTVSVQTKDPKTGEIHVSQQVVCWDSPPPGEWDDGNPLFPERPGRGLYCNTLMLKKPAGCLGQGQIQGAPFGTHQYHPGSGLAAAIYNTTNMAFSPQARTLISNALATHTASLARGTIPIETANANLLDGMRLACSYQAAHDQLNPPLTPWVGGISPAMRACLGTLNRLSGEAGLSFGAFYLNWLHTLGINLAELKIPQTLINWVAPENSLRVKYELIDAQLKCNAWHREVTRNGC